MQKRKSARPNTNELINVHPMPVSRHPSQPSVCLYACQAHARRLSWDTILITSDLGCFGEHSWIQSVLDEQ